MYFKLLLILFPCCSCAQETTSNADDLNTEFRIFLDNLLVKEADTIINLDTTVLYQVNFVSMCTWYNHFIDDRSLICSNMILKGNLNKKNRITHINHKMLL